MLHLQAVLETHNQRTYRPTREVGARYNQFSV
jgi:hypothetical protein